ncbi:endonuclease G, mitochondrial [Drosophila tropicalis]|uniref:endonuclease G, mitochondrial n=1 Tax=Drosophila tropicalis TaxID=46794 RepID=UPI0035ABFA3A
MPMYVTIPLCALTGATAFMMGALTQQDISYRRIKRTMVRDPYVYQCRGRIFSALSLLGRSTQTEPRHKTGLKMPMETPKPPATPQRRSSAADADVTTTIRDPPRTTEDLTQMTAEQQAETVAAAMLADSRRSTILSIESNDNEEVKERRSSSSTAAALRKLEESNSSSIFELFILWCRAQLHKVIMFMTYSIGRDEPPTTKLSHVADLMKYGFPGMDEIHVYKNFVLSYDRRNRIAHWVCEHLNSDCLAYRDPKTLQKPNEYAIDPNIADMFSPSMKDFRNSDWVGGHMASPLNYKCDMDKFIESYIFPNIVPISRGLKNNVWLRLEHYVRDLAMETGSVYVYTGPLFMPQRITFRNWAIRHHVMGMNTIAVPTHFFKVIISEERDALPRMEGYVVPNADIDKEMDLNSFMSDIRDIEHFAGLKFYDGAREEIMRGPRDSIDG